MADSQKTVFVDDEVASQVLDILREAQEYAIIITPYLKLWQHAQTALELAAKRGIKVTVILRSGRWDTEVWGDVAWLTNNDIDVLAAEYLHAKIYLNERSVFLSSMNLTKFSTENSLEIGFAVREPQVAKQVRDYVTNTVMPLTQLVSAPPAEPGLQMISEPTHAYSPTESRHPPVSRAAQPQSQTVLGTCIRCGRPLYPNPEKPLCDPCYDKWAQYENEDYAECFCHICGRPWETSYAKPLCRDCFRKIR
jgi:hypothetical protein